MKTKISVGILVLALIGAGIFLSRPGKQETAAIPAPTPAKTVQIAPARPHQPVGVELAAKPADTRIIRSATRSFDSDVYLFAQRLHGIELTKQQTQLLQDAYSVVYAERLKYEAAHAKVSRVSENVTLVEIPAYPDFGHELQKTFQQSVQDALGAPLATAVLNQLGQTFWARNAYWGELSQQILFTYEPASDTYDVTETTSEKPGFPSATISSTVSADNLDKFAAFSPQLPSKTNQLTPAAGGKTTQ